MFSATFLESHFSSGMGLASGTNCRGPHRTLPLFRVGGLSHLGSISSHKIFYSSYGIDDAPTDPIAAFAGFKGLPFQEFAETTNRQNNGILTEAVCISESDVGHSMWHLCKQEHFRASISMTFCFLSTVIDPYAKRTQLSPDTAQRRRKLTVQQTTISDSYNVVLSFEFYSDGKFKVSINELAASTSQSQYTT